MSTITQTEPSNSSSDRDCHVEMTTDLPAEHDSVEADNDSQINRTPTKVSHEQRSQSSDDETHPNSPWGSFADGSTGSMSSESSWGSAIYRDMRFTMISNLFFLAGACIQTYTAVADLKSDEAEALEDDDDYDDDGCDDDYVYTIADKSWYFCYSLGPLLYILNSLIDVRWLMSHIDSPWTWNFWCHCCPKADNSSLEIERFEQDGQYQRIIEVDTNNSNEMEAFDEESSYSSMDSSIDSAYRAELAWELLAALFFGLGALFEFYSTFLDDYYSDEDDWDDDSYLIEMEGKRIWYYSNYKMEIVGMHLYLFSGIIMLIAQRNSYRSGWSLCFNLKSQDDGDRDNSEKRESENPTDNSNLKAQLLMFLGTVLFVCGTLLDCSIAWFSDPRMRHDIDPMNHMTESTLSIFDLVSSVLWNVDAVLYICADILLYSLHRKGSKGRQWLCKKRVRCRCAGEEENDLTEDTDDDDFLFREDQSPIPMLPSLGGDDCVVKPLLRGSTITSYSSFIKE